MPYNARIFRVLVASPGDVPQEREIVTRTIQEWNDLNSYEKRVVLLPLMWETHSSPELGDRPQAIINRQLVDSCDMLVGVFWTRLGTPTGKAASGTIEEIERVGSSGKLIMLYFSKVKVEIDSVDLDQYKKLKDFKYRTYPKGLVESYSSLLEFRDKFSKQLAMKVRELVSRDAESRESGPDVYSDPLTPKINLALVHVATKRLVNSGESIDIEAVVCVDIDHIQGLLDYSSETEGAHGDLQKSRATERSFLEDRLAYLRELVQYYCLESCLDDFRLAVNNPGDMGVRDLILEINLDDHDGKKHLFGDADGPVRPTRPRRPSSTQVQVNISTGRDFFIKGDRNVVYNYQGTAISDIEVTRENAGWELKFEVPVIQPQRTVASNAQFRLGAGASCVAEFKATVFSGQAPPFKLEGRFNLAVSTREMTYREILDELGEDLADFEEPLN